MLGVDGWMDGLERGNNVPRNYLRSRKIYKDYLSFPQLKTKIKSAVFLNKLNRFFIVGCLEEKIPLIEPVQGL
jgi:hypothetical protein